MRKRVFMFNEGGADQRSLLGGKGANLAEMTRLGLPVPPGFTVSTEACIDYYEAGREVEETLVEEIFTRLSDLEAAMDRRFGDPKEPLLVSVRSGAAVSMPGMMDTILNLGLNDETAKGLAEATQDPRFAYDCYRRLIQIFANVVMGLPIGVFEDVLDKHKEKAGVSVDSALGPDVLMEVVAEFKELVRRLAKREFPQDVREQLLLAVEAVFSSWYNNRAAVYRRIHRIAEDLGTAVNVQAMVFGNMGNDSATGVLFTRDPSSGVAAVLGEYLVNAQGEDVVAGLRTPRPIVEMADELPEAYQQLLETAQELEHHYRDMQDIEFTIERRKLFILQTRTGKRTAQAAVRIAYDLVTEGIISAEEAVGRIEPEQVEKMLHRTIDPGAEVEVLAQGLPASPGAATGVVVFDANEAERRGEAGEKVILVRPETAPDDMHGIVQAQGILTSRGGMTCHAAIVARGMGKPAVVGCDELRIDLGKKQAYARGKRLDEGEVITLDGASGKVMRGQVPLVEPDLGGEFQQVLSWGDQMRRLGVRANADTPADAALARKLGAEGIGLCRTEHMFMASDRLPAMQAMILAETEEERKAALERLLPMQKEDFKGILRAMAGYPVTIRLLDPPLHEFLPRIEELVVALGRARDDDLGASDIEEKEELLRKARALSESNPMLGFRGCRLGIVYPEMYAMQARAIFEATAELIKEGQEDIMPEIMIPLVGHAKELAVLEKVVRATAEEVKEEVGLDFPCVVGTMIEVPRSALTADEVAEHAEFFSFGTNDLTQMTFGYSRDDAEAKFLHHYLQEKVLPENPFAVLDEDGVGKLVKMAVNLGRKTRPSLKIGICGEHGGDPASIAFFHRCELDYVSCSPYRVPVARLAAARAQLAG